MSFDEDNVSGLTAELLTVDDEAQAWDRYYAALMMAVWIADHVEPPLERIAGAATGADRMLEERRKRFPKAGSK